ncbi:hypothetical protein E2C01_035597 [Portunus trituberculatus]|uniref:Uncharacterized protein n=1 Tax=Portunus trituberculatus TaxID=210409 RepID=A0A5B7F8S5_PORTR|nr:hypothetical protein [Portunus trituberculatus]
MLLQCVGYTDTRKQCQLSNAILLEKLCDVKQVVDAMATLKQNLSAISERLDDACKIIHQQQLFLIPGIIVVAGR